MKKLTNHTIYRIALITIIALSILTGNMIVRCYSFKDDIALYAFIGAIAILSCIVIILLLGKNPSFYLEKARTDQTKLNEEERTPDERDKQISKLNKENEALKEQVLRLTNPKNEISEAEQLRKKCETIETFRDSFPYKISDGYVIYNIVRTELRVSAYSKWLIVGVYNGDLWEYNLIRPDTQSHKELLCLVSHTRSLEDLEELNVACKVLYN